MTKYEERPCVICGNHFIPRRSIDAYLCSPKCVGKHLALKRGSLEEKFMRSFQKTDGCWIWERAKTDLGYGIFCVGRKNYSAHRYSYELTNGPIPKGLFICHKCDNPSCINPDHLFAGTPLDNIRDAIAKGRLKPKGEDRSSAKLKNEDVLEIRESYKSKLENQYELARRFNVSRSLITHIVNRKAWTHI